MLMLQPPHEHEMSNEVDTPAQLDAHEWTVNGNLLDGRAGQYPFNCLGYGDPENDGLFDMHRAYRMTDNSLLQIAPDVQKVGKLRH